MDETSNSRDTMLKSGSTLKLEPGCGTTVRVIDGSIWLTQPCDTTDYVMHGGDGMVLSGMGLTLIHAYEDSLLQFAEPDVRSGIHCNHQPRS